MLGAMLCITVNNLGLPLPPGLKLAVSVIAAVLLTTLVGIVVERATIYPARHSPPVTLIIITIGVTITLRAVALLVFLIGALVLGAVWGGGFGMMGRGMMGDYRGYFPGRMQGGSIGVYEWVAILSMCLIPLGFVLLLGAGFAWLVQALGKRDAGAESAAIEILKTRYAKGEISKEEFEQMKDDLS